MVGQLAPKAIRDAAQKPISSHLADCGISHTSETGARVDFHALRHTWCTTLQRSGVGPRSAQQLMRHSDARLTEKGYTDVNLLPLFSEVRKVKVPSLGASLNFGKTRPNQSPVVQSVVIEAGTSPDTETLEPEVESLVLSTVGTPWPEGENGGEGGIRTHGTLSGTPDFESGTIDHSATSPAQDAKT